jgi:hypothetical protein
MLRTRSAITAAVLMLVTPSFAQTIDRSRTPRSSEGIYDQGTEAYSTGRAVRDQSFIGSGGRRSDSSWVGSDPASSRNGPRDVGIDPKQAGQVGETGSGQ